MKISLELCGFPGLDLIKSVGPHLFRIEREYTVKPAWCGAYASRKFVFLSVQLNVYLVPVSSFCPCSSDLVDCVKQVRGNIWACIHSRSNSKNTNRARCQLSILWFALCSRSFVYFTSLKNPLFASLPYALGGKSAKNERESLYFTK